MNRKNKTFFCCCVFRYLTNAQPVLEALLHPQITDLPGHIQAVFVHNIVKLYASILVKAEAEVSTVKCNGIS